MRIDLGAPPEDKPALPAGVVTFVFTDIEGSTGLVRDNADAYAVALADHQAIVRAALRANGGAEVRTEGDAFFAAFAVPSAAVAACVDAQLALRRHDWPDGIDLRVRMGLHTGDATPTTDRDYVALAVHEAARVVAAANGGQVLVTQAVCDLAGGHLPDGVTLKPLGSFRLKDFDEPAPILQVNHPDLPSAFPPPRVPSARRHNLPRFRTSFVGRDAEMESLTKVVAVNRLVTVTGPGGTGKTRLVVETADRIQGLFPDGIWFAPLAAVTDERAIPAAVAAAAGVHEQPGGDLLGTLLKQLTGTKTLLVIDNCEHLLAACGAFVDRLLAAEALTIVVTSREPLHIEGEVAFALPPLTAPDPALPSPLLLENETIALFFDRASAADAHFTLDPEQTAAVARVCRDLDGLPLAIELAAACTRFMTVEQIAGGLERRFSMLNRGPRTAEPRHQTLRATVDWSHSLLTDDERALFRRLAVFAGGFNVDSAVDVLRGTDLDDVAAGVGRLVDKSLLVLERDGGRFRFRMLDTIRRYADERRIESGEDAEYRARHGRWAAAVAHTAAAGLLGPEQPGWIVRLDAERPNLDAALAWAESEDAGVLVEMCSDLLRFWLDRAYLSEGRQWVDTALAISAGGTGSAHLEAGAARLAVSHGDYAAALAHASLAIVQAGVEGDAGALSRAHQAAGEVAVREGRHEAARLAFEASLAPARAAGDRLGVVVAMHGLGSITRAEGRIEAARRSFSDALELARQVGHPPTVAASLGFLGETLLLVGDLDEARSLFEEELATARRAGHRYIIAYALGDLSNVAVLQGDYGTAQALLEDSLEVAVAMGDRQSEARALIGLGQIARVLGDPQLARAQLERALELARSVGLAVCTQEALERLSQLAFSEGDVVGARAALIAALHQAAASGQQSSAWYALNGLAELAEHAGDYERAALLLGAASAVAPETSSATADFAALSEILERAIGHDAVHAGTTAGRALAFADMVALAEHEPGTLAREVDQ